MEKIEQMTIQKVVLDAGPIIHLDEITCLHLLSDFKELLVPEAVWKEIGYLPSFSMPSVIISTIRKI